MNKKMIEQFLSEMRVRYQNEIDAVALPDGTLDYIADRVAAGDADTLLFMLKLGYLMGLQTGYAAGAAGDARPNSGSSGPLQA